MMMNRNFLLTFGSVFRPKINFNQNKSPFLLKWLSKIALDFPVLPQNDVRQLSIIIF